MLIDQVAGLLSEAADKAIMPRFQRLERLEIAEKSPGEIVTAADRDAEALISPALLKLLPESRVVGEEACAADPELLRNLGTGIVWLVDPLDGTANFAVGKVPFSIMVALLKDGETVLSRMLDPVGRELCVAERGSGATINGSRVSTDNTPVGAQLQGAILSKFMPPEVRESLEASSDGLARLPGMFCAGAEYPAIVKGDRDFAIFWRTLPWDHAPGTLFLQEAGGTACRPNGEVYHTASEGSGLILARTRQILCHLMERFSF